MYTQIIFKESFLVIFFFKILNLSQINKINYILFLLKINIQKKMKVNNHENTVKKNQNRLFF